MTHTEQPPANPARFKDCCAGASDEAHQNALFCMKPFCSIQTPKRNSPPADQLPAGGFRG